MLMLLTLGCFCLYGRSSAAPVLPAGGNVPAAPVVFRSSGADGSIRSDDHPGNHWNFWGLHRGGPLHEAVFLPVADAQDPLSAQILDYINEMRKAPSAFYKKYLKSYIKEHGDRFTAFYTQSLRRDMQNAGNLSPFTTEKALTGTAGYQARYLKKFRGKRLDHDAPGLSFEQRLRNAGIGCGGENLYTGQNRTALQVVMDLLIDQGVRSVGHRKNLLNPQYTRIGIAVGRFSGNGAVVVMDFGCKP
ncbi:hypothetical protein GCM10023143_01180 [Compostibacter hankyongensis]|uniref:SCP domain-containing protein n=2 Tax=Compostibacter hankyongensis TaxID=1007089 RepID=A0ABP8FCV2_9BACT